MTSIQEPILEVPRKKSSLALGMAHNSLWNMGGLFMSALLGFVTSPLLIHLLGKDHYGLMILLVSILTPLGLLDFGIGEATVKYVAESIGRRDATLTGKYLRSTLLFNLSMGVVWGWVVISCAGFLTTSLFNIPANSQVIARHCLYWIGIHWCVMQVRQTFIGTVTAMQRFGILNVGTFISQAITIGAGLGVLFLGGNLLDLIRTQAIIAAIVGLGWLIIAKRLLPGILFIPRLDWGTLSKTLGFGFWQMLNNVGGILGHQSGRWLLGVLLPVSAVGFYDIGMQLVTMVYLVTYKVGQVLFPAVSQMQGEGHDEQAARFVVQANWVLTTLAISCFVPLIVLSHDLLLLWVGPDFAANTTVVLRILAFGDAASCLFAIHNFYLLGTGRSKWLAPMSFAQGSITFTVSALLIPRLGLVGAGWGMASSSIVHVSMLILMWKRIFRVWIPARVYFSATFSQFIVGVVTAIGFMQLRSTITWSPNWILIGVAGSVCAAISAIIIITIDRYLPGGSERRELLLQLCVSRIPLLSRLSINHPYGKI